MVNYRIIILPMIILSLVAINLYFFQTPTRKTGEYAIVEYLPFSKPARSVAYDIATDTAGNIYITGRISNTIFVAKYNETKKLIWYKIYNLTTNYNITYGTGIDVDLYGNIYVSVVNYDPVYSRRYSYVLKLDNNGNILWNANFTEKTTHLHDVKVNNTDGTVYAVGAQSGYQFVVKLSQSGTILWTKYFSFYLLQSASAYALTINDSYIYVVGITTEYNAHTDATLLKINAYGVKIWDAIYGETNYNTEAATDVIVNESIVYVACHVYSSVTNSSTLCLLSYAPNGTNLGFGQHSYLDYDIYSRSIAIKGDRVYVLGSMFNNVTFIGRFYSNCTAESHHSFTLHDTLDPQGMIYYPMNSSLIFVGNNTYDNISYAIIVEYVSEFIIRKVRCLFPGNTTIDDIVYYDNYYYIAGSVDKSYVFIAKLTASGDVIWERHISSQDLFYARSFKIYATEQGDLYITYTANCTGYIQKYSHDGNFIWKKYAYNWVIYDIIEDDTGCILAGISELMHGVLLKISKSTGDLMWSISIRYNNSELSTWTYDVESDEKGYFYVLSRSRLSLPPDQHKDILFITKHNINGSIIEKYVLPDAYLYANSYSMALLNDTLYILAAGNGTAHLLEVNTDLSSVYAVELETLPAEGGIITSDRRGMLRVAVYGNNYYSIGCYYPVTLAKKYDMTLYGGQGFQLTRLAVDMKGYILLTGYTDTDGIVEIFDRDSDGDDLCDVYEQSTGTNPYATDSDGDGIDDWNEVNVYGTSPLISDSDNDKMPDKWEIDHGLNATANDAEEDPDSDNLTNYEEYQYSTDPADEDTDNDGLPDGWEAHNGLNPLVADASMDPDHDGLTNQEEYNTGTAPLNHDTDGDMLADGDEQKYGTNPLNADTDNDGIPDGQEIAYGTNPLDENSYFTPSIVSTLEILLVGAFAVAGVSIAFSVILLKRIKSIKIASMEGERKLQEEE